MLELRNPRLPGALVLLLLSAGLGAACVGGSDVRGDLAVDESAEHGPAIVFDPLALPIAEVPFPNDLSLRVTDETNSGLAWNVSPDQPSAHSSRVRELMNGLDGFGPFAPAFVSFEGPLDLSTVNEDTVMIVNIEPGDPREGEKAALVLNSGLMPGTMRDPKSYFAHDPYASEPDFVFPPTNLADADGDGTLERVEFWEVSSNTLILQPFLPLAQGARYAVLITRGVEGWREGPDGEQILAPVRSPFRDKAHRAQEDLIRHALDLVDMDPEQLAFGWTFTTSDVVTPLVDLRRGLYGEGQFAHLKDVVEPVISDVRDTGIGHDSQGMTPEERAHDTTYLLQAEFLGEVLSLFSMVQDDSSFNVELSHVDYFVFGSVMSPNFRLGAKRDFDLNFHTGEGPVEPAEVPFIVSIPKETAEHKQPFPVMFYFHGTGTSRMESVAISDSMAQQGVAVMSFDQVGHGPLVPDIPLLIEDNPEYAGMVPLLVGLLADILAPDRADEIRQMSFEDALAEFEKIGLFRELAVLGRNEDENGNGALETAESFYFADPFRMCSSFWQDLADFFQLVRVVRSLSQGGVPSMALDDPSEATWEELKPYLLSGDFDANGVLDMGGPDAFLSLAGTSMGGLHSVMAAALEPEVTVVSPIVAGGAFSNMMLRSNLDFVAKRLFLEILGTVMVGCNDGAGRVWVSLGDDSDKCKPEKLEEASFGDFAAAPPGTPILLENLSNGERKEGMIDVAGGFSIAVETDPGDELRLTIDPESREPAVLSATAVVEGSGYERNTKDLRRITMIQQNVLGRCDPINFARNLFWDPLPGHPPTSVLFLDAVGDRTVPISNEVQLAAAAGVFGQTREEWQPRLEALRDVGLLNYAHYDVDDIRGDNPPDEPAIGVQTPYVSAGRESSVRFADVDGKHEWAAGYLKDDFNFGIYTQNQVAVYHACQGRLILDQPADCLQTRDCELLDHVQEMEGCKP